MNGEKIAVTPMPDKKKYMPIEFGDELFAKMKKQNNDPREMIKQMMRCEYTELGRSTIDGVEVDASYSTASIACFLLYDAHAGKERTGVLRRDGWARTTRKPS